MIKRALELAGVGGVDAEIGRKLHRAAHALGDVAERAVGEDRRVQRGEKVVVVRHHRAEIFLHQVGMVLHRFGERAEDDAQLAELFLERGGHGDAVEDRVHGHAGEPLLLVERNAELLEGAPHFGIDFVQAVELLFLSWARSSR